MRAHPCLTQRVRRSVIAGFQGDLEVAHRPRDQRVKIEAPLDELKDRGRVVVLMRDAGLVEALGDEQGGYAGAGAPLIGSFRIVAVTIVRRGRYVVPGAAELVVGNDDERVLAVRPINYGLDQLHKMRAAFSLVGVAGMLVLLTDRLDEADRLERAFLGSLDELRLIEQVLGTGRGPRLEVREV